jgi:hypothetical protein
MKNAKVSVKLRMIDASGLSLQRNPMTAPINAQMSTQTENALLRTSQSLRLPMSTPKLAINLTI